MKYERDIKERTKEFAVVIVKFTIELKKQGIEYPLRDQLLRSGTSIGANVKEAKASSTKKELIRFYEIALRSADETEFWMEIIKDGYEMKNNDFEPVQKELKEITRIIATIVINLKK